ncbi:TonB-dependent siderophore receptor [Brevundimonas sp. PAMC22021]|uniref:TonB-dependent receptor plug domain-containing protein n=1 Tax=Brevundimonas sp. PAMC22021 TaxID=2861285 RepID=UPI001C6265BF|nr:TonB-dependent receptor [Brevundimonas sp. PAMC22021]QYF86254.1 outer membrane beta-barrel protein [Brevundimonas sp. PAMC22021]
MTRTILLTTTALLLSTGAASAETTPPKANPQAAQAPVPTGPTTEAPLADAAQQGVLVFTPDFFADQRPDTALDMVDRVPGFQIDDGSGARGFEGAVGNILINNARPASKNDTGSSVLSRTLARQVERVELIRGGAPGIDMQGYSVVVNVILKAESSRQSVFSANRVFFEGGQDVSGASYQFTAREGDRSWGVTLSDGVSMSDSNGRGRTIRRNAAGVVTRDEQTVNDGYGGGNSIRGNYAGPLAGGKIDLTARIGVNDWQSYDISQSPTVFRESQSAEDGVNGEVGATYTRPLTPTLKLETRLIHEFSDFDGASTYSVMSNGLDEPDQVFSYDGKSSESILRALVRQERSPRITLELGGEVAYNMLDTEQALTVGGAVVPLPSASVKVEETRGEAFGKGTYRVRPNLTLEAGLRLEASTISQSGDADQEKSFFFAKPRVLATWTPMPNNQLRFRFERELGQLDFSDFAASADLEEENVFGGNVDLEPEQRWISELTYERRFWGEGVLSLGYRHDEIVNAIDVIPLADELSATGNIGDGSLDQLAVSLTLPTDKLGVSGGQFKVSNSWNHTEVTDPTTGETRAISGVRPSQAEFSFQQDLTRLKLQWGVFYLAGFRDPRFDPDQRQLVRISDYKQAWIEYKPTASLTLRGEVTLWDDFTIDRTFYGDRETQAVAFTERREIDPRTFYRVSLRKTF